MKKIKDYSKLKLGLEIVAVIFLITVAFSIRVIPSYNVVFQKDAINYSSVDDYFYMRIVDNMMVNWPNFTEVDMYRNYPEGTGAGNTRLFHPVIIVAISKVINIDPNLTAAWLPPIYGTLAILCLYFMARFVFKRGPALIGLTLLAVIPGEFASRTSLGAIDQHCLEIFLSAFMISFFILSLSAKSMTGKIILSLVAGIGMALYMKAWEGAALFIAIITVAIGIWWIIECINEMRGLPRTPSPYLQVLICAIAVIAVLLLTGFSYIQLLAVTGMAAGTTLLWIADKIKVKLRLLIVFVSFMIIYGISWFIWPEQVKYTINYVLGYISLLFGWSFTTATAEEAPLFIMNGEFTLSQAWISFAGTMYFFLVGIGILAYSIMRKQNRIGWLMVLTWGIMLFIATMAMRRSSYYFAIPLCIISGYFCWLLYIWIATVDKKKGIFSPGTILIITSVIAMFSVIPFISIDANSSIAGGTISPGWRESIDWMKDNTIEPIPNGYTSTYIKAEYPDTAYGIMTWWDYGYWILREGHRITYSDPGGGNRRFCGWFLSTDNVTEVMESIKSMKIKYIIIDYSMTTGKNYSIVQHAAAKATDFQEPFRTYYDRRSGSYSQLQVNYTSYYKELMVRLYNFNGMAVDSPGCPVFRYEEIDGNREVIEAIDLPDYDTAVSYIAQHKDAKYVLGGTNPFLSPIKMDPLPQFKPVFFSKSGIDAGNGQLIPEVKIFEVVE